MWAGGSGETVKGSLHRVMKAAQGSDSGVEKWRGGHSILRDFGRRTLPFGTQLFAWKRES